MGVIRKLRPFVTRSNRERASAVIRLRNKIPMERHIYGGRFIGSPDMVDPDRPVLYQQDDYVFFPGTDKRVLWNAYIVTARKAFWDAIGSLASDRAWAMLSRDEKSKEARLDFQPAEFNAWGEATSYTLPERIRRYEQFSGKSLRDYEAQVEKEIIANEPPEIYESFSVDRGYEYGIGLQVVVDAEMINKETVERVIDRFLEIGETDWRAETPVPRDKLPFETEMDAMMTIPPEQR